MATSNMVDLQRVVDAVTRRAAEQGSLLPREVRQEIANAGADPSLWKQVIKLAGPSLELRRGRYHYVASASPLRERQQRQQQVIHDAVHALVEQYRAAVAQQERRETDRITFIQPVSVELPDGRLHAVLTKDISPSGLRLLGGRSLLGQKLRVTVPRPDGTPVVFLVRVLWSCMVGDDLYENGGSFLEVVQG
jgi:hypothetical protein